MSTIPKAELDIFLLSKSDSVVVIRVIRWGKC